MVIMLIEDCWLTVVVGAFWCSYVGVKYLLMFKSLRLRPGRFRQHSNWLPTVQLQNNCKKSPCVCSSLNSWGIIQVLSSIMLSFPYFERRAMHMQPCDEPCEKAKPFCVHLSCPIPMPLSLLSYNYFVRMSCSLVADHVWPWSRVVDSSRFSLLAKLVLGDFCNLVPSLQIFMSSSNSNRYSIVDLHGRRRSGALAVVGGKAHACLCFLYRIWLLLQGSYSAQLLASDWLALDMPPELTCACAPCPSDARACWPHSRKTLRILYSSSGPGQAGLLWASHS